MPLYSPMHSVWMCLCLDEHQRNFRWWFFRTRLTNATSFTLNGVYGSKLHHRNNYAITFRCALWIWGINAKRALTHTNKHNFALELDSQFEQKSNETKKRYEIWWWIGLTNTENEKKGAQRKKKQNKSCNSSRNIINSNNKGVMCRIRFN